VRLFRHINPCMFRRLVREFYLLRPGERRGLLLVTLLLTISLAARMLVQVWPRRDPPGIEAFMQESQLILEQLAGRQTEDPATEMRAPGPSSRHMPQSVQVLQEPLSINAADSAALLPLPGIGPVYAGRIVRYRNLLGGFVRLEQLAEVYGLSRDRVGALKPLVFIDTSLILRIPVNHAEFGQLLRHPYLDYPDVVSLVRYRDFSGPILSLGQIRIHGLLSDSTVARLAPYLDLSR